MLTFDPSELEAELRETLRTLTDTMTVLLDDENIDHDFALDIFDDGTINATSEIVLSFPYSDIDVALTVRDLIELAAEATDPKTLFDGRTFHSRARTIMRVMSWDLRTISFVERVTENRHVAAKVLVDLRGHASVGLRAVSPHYGAAVVLKGHFYNKYHPPLQDDDIFIEVSHPQGANEEAAMAVIQAYLFELHTSLGLEFFEASRPSEEAEYPEDEEIGELTARASTLRPLLVGDGMSVLLQEFNRGHGAMSQEAALLSYVKCIEYVSTTVVREKQYEDLRKRLLTREALNPHADFLDGLLTLFECSPMHLCAGFARLQLGIFLAISCGRPGDGGGAAVKEAGDLAQRCEIFRERARGDDAASSSQVARLAGRADRLKGNAKFSA